MFATISVAAAEPVEAKAVLALPASAFDRWFLSLPKGSGYGYLYSYKVFCIAALTLRIFPVLKWVGAYRDKAGLHQRQSNNA